MPEDISVFNRDINDVIVIDSEERGASNKKNIQNFGGYLYVNTVRP
jgi:hypothetical protein